jgi:kinesin family protein 2/24
VVHNCLFHADLVRMHIHHSGYCFPRAFGPTATNAEVYAECGSPLVIHALSGNLSTLFLFGQTGSGKTFTMNAILEAAIRQVFSSTTCSGGDAAISFRAFEVAGKKCFDLVRRERTELKLLDDKSGRTNVVGATEKLARSAQECLQELQSSLSRRATSGHARNDESSRSHCICMLDLLASGGSLTLVDCAGTETAG